jgi:hypothetical protein
MRWEISTVFTIVSLLCVVATTVSADDRRGDLERSIEELDRKLEAQRQPRKEKPAPVAKRGDGFAAVKESLNEIQPADQEESTASGDEESESPPLRVTAHLRVQSGVVFPPAESVVLPPFPEGDVASYMSASEPARWESTPVKYERPSRCEKNFTNRTLRYPELDDSTLIHEKIYLSQDLVPLDTSEVYGPKVRLLPYGGENAELENRRMTLDQVPCVPFRRRLTAAALYEDYGTAALKNYSQKPSGNGVLHAWVEQKLYGKR